MVTSGREYWKKDWLTIWDKWKSWKERRHGSKSGERRPEGSRLEAGELEELATKSAPEGDEDDDDEDEDDDM